MSDLAKLCVQTFLIWPAIINEEKSLSSKFDRSCKFVDTNLIIWSSILTLKNEAVIKICQICLNCYNKLK